MQLKEIDFFGKETNLGEITNKIIQSQIILTEILQTNEDLLAKKTINIEYKIFSDNDIIWIHLHENEWIAYDVAQNFASQIGGKFIAIKQNKERFIRFCINGQCIRIDPNRIFTDLGLEKTIKERNLHLLEDNFTKAFNEGIKIRNQILEKINHNNTIIAMHNNKSLNILNYKDIGEIYINPDLPQNCFVIVSLKDDFLCLKSLGINVVFLKDKENDGGFYDYAFEYKIRYFNIETGYQHKDIKEGIIKKMSKIILN